MKVIGKFRRDIEGSFLPESTCDNLQLRKAAKLDRLLQDTQRDADILKQSGNGNASGEAIVVSDTTFTSPEKDVCKATNLSYDPNSGEVQSYSTRIVGPGERIKLSYSARPLMLEVNASALSGSSVKLTRRLQLKQVGDNLYELSEGTVRR